MYYWAVCVLMCVLRVCGCVSGWVGGCGCRAQGEMIITQ